MIRPAIFPSWSSRNFEIIFVARVAMSVGRSLAGVVTPVYLALEGFSAFELAEYVLVVSVVSALLSTLVGLSSDSIGRRPYLVAMPLLTATAGVAFALSDATPVLFAMGAVGSFGRGAGAGSGAVGPYQPAESAFVTEVLAARHRNSAFGRLAFGSSLGATVGGLLALLVSSHHVHGAVATSAFRPAFLAIAAVSALAGIVALALDERDQQSSIAGSGPGDAVLADDAVPSGDAVLAGEGVAPDKVLPPPAPPSDVAHKARTRLRLPRRSRWLLYRLWVTNTVNGLAIGMFGPFVTYWLFRRYGASAGEIGALFAVINIATMPSTLSASRLAKRWGLVRTIAVVRTAQALLIVPMLLAPTFVLAGAAYLLRMAVQRIGMPLRQSYSIGLADPDERASVAALSNVPSQLAMAFSPLLTGYLFDEVSLYLPFEIASALQLTNAVSFWAFFRHHPPEEERTATPDLSPHPPRSE